MPFNFNKKKKDEDFEMGKSRKKGYYDKSACPTAQLQRLKGLFHKKIKHQFRERKY